MPSPSSTSAWANPKTDGGRAAPGRLAALLGRQDQEVPLLIGQGANDPRVKQAESEQIVAAIEKNGGGVTYVLYPDEGHGFARPENRIDFNARAEAFLAACLGGRVEPLPEGDKVPGSTAVVKVVGGKYSRLPAFRAPRAIPGRFSSRALRRPESAVGSSGAASARGADGASRDGGPGSRTQRS